MNTPNTKDPIEVKKGDTVIINTDKPVVYNHYYFRRSSEYFTVGYYLTFGIIAALSTIYLLCKFLDIYLT